MTTIVDIVIIQKVQDIGIHLKVDEEQWKITQGCKRQAKWVRSPRAMSGSTVPRYSLCTETKRPTVHGFRPETIERRSIWLPTNDTQHVLCLEQTGMTINS